MSAGAFWSPERYEDLRRLVDEGLTAAQISERLGCSRNAVMGKVNRLKLRLARPGSGGVRRSTGVKTLRAGARIVEATRRVDAERPAARERMAAILPEPRADEPAAEPVSFDHAVDAGLCLFFADIDARPGPLMPVCGAPRDPQGPCEGRYCRRHRRLQSGAGTEGERLAGAVLLKLGRAA